MARDGRPPPFPFPIPDPPRVQPQSTPFPPPPLPSPEETARLLARRVAGLPLPLFFAIGAVVGIVLAVTVVSLVRRTSSRRATQAKVVSVQASPVVEHARALFVWPPAAVGERARASAPPASLDEASLPPLPVASPRAPAAAPAARPVVAVNRPRATARTKAPSPEKREEALPSNLLAAGL